MPVIKGFGERLAQERRQMSVRQRRDILKKDLARELDVSESTVGRWENGTVPDDPETLERLARYFGVTAAWLHYGAEPRERPATEETVEAPATYGGQTIADTLAARQAPATESQSSKPARRKRAG